MSDVQTRSRDQAAFNPTIALAVSPAVAGLMLGFGRTTIYQLLKRGELKSYLEGPKARRILVSSIQEYIARKTAASQQQP